MNEAREARAAAARARFAELATKFIERSRGEVATMRGLQAKISAGDAAAPIDIRHVAHRMAGTGATLGLMAVSDCAARIEKLVERSLAGTGGAIADAELAAAIDALEGEIMRARGP